MKIVIIGGVAGGASTAARLRRNAESAEIIMFERGNEVSYANCGIPYHIGNVITDREELVLVTPQFFKNTLNVDVRVLSEVTSINTTNKAVTVKNLRTGEEYTETYDKLVLSPGGTPIRPTLPGSDNQNIYTIRNLQDMDNVKKNIDERKPKRAVVIGAGFIGLEMAENLHHRGLQVAIIEQADQVMNVVDFEIAAQVHQHLKTKNVGLYLKDGVVSFTQDAALHVNLKSGKSLATDIVIMSIGVRPDTTLAKQAGLEIGTLGGIKVNPQQQTSNTDIYALGDATEIIDSVCDCPALIPLANSANKQARIVADHICGLQRDYTGTPGTAIAKVFDITVATTGNSEKTLQRRNIPYDKVYLQPSSHAGYYPNAFPLIVKMLFSPHDGRILGAQIVGSAGVDKRIDVLATLIQLHQTVYTLAKLELAYAPPFSSAKDPVNLAGMIAINQIEGRTPSVFWNDVPQLIEQALFIDVRSPLEFELKHISGAINIPLAQIRNRLSEIPKNKPVVVYCNQGKQAYFALSILSGHGYTNVKNLNGGMKVYYPTTLPQNNVDVFEKTYIDKKDDIHMTQQKPGSVISVDACGMQCPGPIMKLASTMNQRQVGDIIAITTTDPGFTNDIAAWCESTGNELLSINHDKGKITANIQKGQKLATPSCTAGTDKTLIIFSNDLDKAIASFIIANGATAMGRKVTLFFTFWGLNILRKTKSAPVKKSILDIMFGFMMPQGSTKLTLSKMHMAGIGGQMIRMVMRQKHVFSLEELISQAQKSGITFIACQMSMDVMGIKAEELIDGVQIGGVANYLNAAEKADTNLFI